MIIQSGDVISQIKDMVSGAMRPGREDQYDAPLSPSKVLLDDINHKVIEWKGFLEPVDFGDCNYNYKLCERVYRTRDSDTKAYFAESSGEQYQESHHIT